MCLFGRGFLFSFLHMEQRFKHWAAAWNEAACSDGWASPIAVGGFAVSDMRGMTERDSVLNR